MKLFNRMISLILLLSVLVCALPVYAVESQSLGQEIPYIDHDTSVADKTYDGNVTAYYGQEGIDAGIPEGFSGEVLRITPNTDPGHAGVCVDFGDQNIDIAKVESITFRIYIPAGGASEFRILNKAKVSSWVVRAEPSSYSAWVDVVLDTTSGFMSGCSLETLANSDGNLGAFCIVYRLKGSSGVGYLDSINIEYKEGASEDKTAPVISYSGSYELVATEGEVFTPEGISAFDEYDNSAARLSYEWSEGALDSAGALKAGTHICTVKAQDRSGNVATLELTVIAKADASLIRIEKVPHIPHDTAIADAVYDGNVTELTEDEARAKGVADGYKGSVFEIAAKSGTSYIGVCLDFSKYAIPISIVESISFNILMPTAYSELRMRNANTSDWLMRCASAPTGAWNTVVMNSGGLNFFGSSKMQMLANGEGNLGSFCLIGRNNGSYSPYYIDSVIIKLKSDDGVAPVLNYSGKTDIRTSAGKPFAPGITAYDELEERDVALSYTWSDGAVDQDGNMLEGEHSCRVSATDYYGNSAYIDINLSVGPPDVEAPVIAFTAEEIFVPVGTYYRMVHTAVDNYDEVEVVEAWSDGAIDLGGRLSEGVHTLTLTATDLSGNSFVHVVTVHVLSTDTTVGTLIQCGK